jgi:hypothetical protein
MRGNEGAGKALKGKQYEFVSHAVAIHLSPVFTIGTIHDNSHTWRRHCDFETYGLTRDTASAAIKDAYRFVRSTKFDLENLSVKIDINPALAYAKNGSIIWKIKAWLLWKSWNDAGLTIDERIDNLHELGHPTVTAKALQRAAEERGL